MDKHVLLGSVITAFVFGVIGTNAVTSDPPPTREVVRTVEKEVIRTKIKTVHDKVIPQSCLDALQYMDQLDKLLFRYESEVMSKLSDTPDALSALSSNRNDGDRQVRANAIQTRMRNAEHARMEITADMQTTRVKLKDAKELCQTDTQPAR